MITLKLVLSLSRERDTALAQPTAFVVKWNGTSVDQVTRQQRRRGGNDRASHSSNKWNDSSVLINSWITSSSTSVVIESAHDSINC